MAPGVADYKGVNMEQDTQDQQLSQQELADPVIGELLDIWNAALNIAHSGDFRFSDDRCGECGQATGKRNEHLFLLVQARRIRSAAAGFKAFKAPAETPLPNHSLRTCGAMEVQVLHDGAWYTLPVVAADPVLYRIDRIVWQNGNRDADTGLRIITGPRMGLSQVAPAALQPGQLDIGQVYVGAGATSIVDADILAAGWYQSDHRKLS
jgi:hypothetical protein